jgi:hypothetical protein
VAFNPNAHESETNIKRTTPKKAKAVHKAKVAKRLMPITHGRTKRK